MIGLSRGGDPNRVSKLFYEDLGLVPWHIEKDGVDLVINGWGTAFGTADPEDDGQTASGVDLNRHPHLKGVALPFRTRSVHSLRNSPLPHMPFGVDEWAHDKEGAHVELEDAKTGVIGPIVPVIDLGPALWTGVAVDLTVKLAQLFDIHASATNFKRRFNIRIVNGAIYL
jgi:hypothetical protein